MSRIVKTGKAGGLSFKPVARPKPKAAADAPPTPEISQSTQSATQPQSSPARPSVQQHGLAPPPPTPTPTPHGRQSEPSLSATGITLTNGGPAASAGGGNKDNAPPPPTPPATQRPAAATTASAPISMAPPASASARRPSQVAPIAIGASTRRPAAVDLSRPTMPNPYAHPPAPKPIMTPPSTSGATAFSRPPTMLAPPSASRGSTPAAPRPVDSQDANAHMSLQAVREARDTARQAEEAQDGGEEPEISFDLESIASVFGTVPPPPPQIVDRRRGPRKKHREEQGGETTSESASNQRKKAVRKRKTPISGEDSNIDPELAVMQEEAAQAAEANDVAQDGTPSAKKKRAKRAPGRTRSQNGAELLDERAAPGQATGPPIDPSAMTMAEIARRPGQGRVSNRGLEIQRMLKEQREKAAAAEAAADSAAIEVANGNAAVATNLEAQPSQSAEGSSSGDAFSRIMGTYNAAAAQAKDTTRSEDGEDEDGLGGGFTAAAGGPRVRMGADGQLVIDEESTVIDEHRQAQEELFSGNVEYVEEDDRTRFVNSMTHSRKGRGSKWSAEEDEMFFEKFREFGSDFGLIAMLLPNKTRKQVRNRFNRASREEPERLEQCWNTKVAIDVDALGQAANIDFNEPLPAEAQAILDGRPFEREPSATPSAHSRSERGPSEDRRQPTTNKRKSKAQKQREMDEGLEIVGDVE